MTITKPAPIKQANTPRTTSATPNLLSNRTTHPTSSNITVVDALILSEKERGCGDNASVSVLSSPLSPPRIPSMPFLLSGRHVHPSYARTEIASMERNSCFFIVTVLEEVLKTLAEDNGDFEDDTLPGTTTTTASRTRHSSPREGGRIAGGDPFWSSFQRAPQQ